MAITLGKDCLLLLAKNHMLLELLGSAATCHMFLICRCQKLLHSVQGTLPEAVLILSLLQKSMRASFMCFLPGHIVCFGVCYAHILTSLCLRRMTEKELDFGPYDKDDYDEPEEGKVAAKAAVKAAKKAADAKEKRFQAAIAEKAVADAAQKEIDDILAGMNPDQKVRMLAAMGVVAASPDGTKCKYDHDANIKRLIAYTASVRALMETYKDDYESVNYMGALCIHWKTLMPLDRAQTNEHVAFMKHFNKERHLYGLPEPASSRASSRASSVPLDISIEEGSTEDEEAGAGADLP